MDAIPQERPKLSRLAIAAFVVGLWYVASVLTAAGATYLSAWTNGGGTEAPDWAWVPSELLTSLPAFAAEPVAALLLGTMAIISIRRNGGTLRGEDLAIAGMALALLPVCLLLLWRLPSVLA